MKTTKEVKRGKTPPPTEAKMHNNVFARIRKVLKEKKYFENHRNVTRWPEDPNYGLDEDDLRRRKKYGYHRKPMKHHSVVGKAVPGLTELTRIGYTTWMHKIPHRDLNIGRQFQQILNDADVEYLKLAKKGKVPELTDAMNKSYEECWRRRTLGLPLTKSLTEGNPPSWTDYAHDSDFSESSTSTYGSEVRAKRQAAKERELSDLEHGRPFNPPGVYKVTEMNYCDSSRLSARVLVLKRRGKNQCRKMKQRNGRAT